MDLASSFFHSNAHRWATRLATVAVAVVIASCSSATGLCACSYPPARFSLPVSGTVTRADGSAAKATFVDAFAFEGSCPASGVSGAITNASATTDTTGKFRIDLRAPTAHQTACVRLRAYAVSPAVDGGPTVIVDRANRRFDLVNELPVDTIVVAITLPQP